jgi:hypothetical protein
MINKIALVLMFILPLCSFGQMSNKLAPSKQVSKNPTLTFEEYCLSNAVSYITVLPEKVKSLKFSGEFQSLENNKKSSYVDYGVQLKENETQYFKLIGSDKVLAIQSLNSLRINYTNSKK